MCALRWIHRHWRARLPDYEWPLHKAMIYMFKETKGEELGETESFSAALTHTSKKNGSSLTRKGSQLNDAYPPWEFIFKARVIEDVHYLP